MTDHRAGLAWAGDGEGAGGVLAATGPWVIATAGGLARDIAAVRPRPGARLGLDLSGLAAVDTVGALLLLRLVDRLEGDGIEVGVTGARPEHAALIEAVHRADRSCEPSRLTRAHPIVAMVERTGRATVQAARELASLLSFLGMMVAALGRTAIDPRRLRITALVHHMEQTGLNALPIVGLLSFLIGVVLAYQGADQLRQFGAELFVVNLLGISILREIGILMTSIIIAGRSGSAFTAQIGTMKVNLEVDALRTLGLDPMELLVLPRALALMVTLPLLAFYADVVGLVGGAVMCYFVLDISFGQFVQQLHGAITVSTLMVGLSKAPVFAFVIALVGCYEGLKVSGSAESVGRLTTRSVVVGIFLVIVLDALFSILFSYIGV
ncbi:ABC transporter permease [Skermanella mucosa]|uniref:MlaE family ABC transporter permease n=1 Tax=Skermanella mucosa TaxID=1789672 RepID=UPI00192C9CFC|nr:ABC transporter permease [Skermanella mucosa]UEM19557.1 ABC transporter permease [Skermanella mucosa]